MSTTNQHITTRAQPLLRLLYPSLYEIGDILNAQRTIDLSHPVCSAAMQENDVTYATHSIAPAHHTSNLRTAEDISVGEMLLPLVVLDIHHKVAHNADYTITMHDVLRWEARYGDIPAGAFVALRTDWSTRWPDRAALQNKDTAGVSHTPGWSSTVVHYLFDTCDVTACGYETLHPYAARAIPEEKEDIAMSVLGQNRYQVALLAQLDRLPEYGAIIVVSWPRFGGCTRVATRVFAIVP